MRHNVRYLVDNKETIGEKSAAETFSPVYLDAVFGFDQRLLLELKRLIAAGVAENPGINLGEVTAMVVVYNKLDDDRVTNVAVRVLGGFPIHERKPGLHRDGFFGHQIDRNLWAVGNSTLSLLGRDMLIFADPDVAAQQQELNEAVLTGSILPLAKSIESNALHYVALFPDPRRVVPVQMKPHIQALVLKGFMSPAAGSWEADLLTTSPRASSYVLDVVDDLRTAAIVALKTRFDGVVHQSSWGPYVSTWWAVAMVDTLTKAVLEKRQSVVSLKADHGRVMVNATLKSIERMGRDMVAMRGVMDDRLDPRIVDQRMDNGKPLHYWSREHMWGPDWPIAGPPTNRLPAAASTNAVTASTR